MDVPANGRRRIVVITGMSGSGKSTAIRALEDAGFFCIDNLPVVLLPKLTELAELAEPDTSAWRWWSTRARALPPGGAAASSDEVRDAPGTTSRCSSSTPPTRPGPPLLRDAPPPPARARRAAWPRASPAEREALRDLRELADQVIDTSQLNVHDLKRLVQARFGPSRRAALPAR